MTRRIIAIVAIVVAVIVLALAVGLAVHRHGAHVVRGYSAEGAPRGYGYGQNGAPYGYGYGGGQNGAPSGGGYGPNGMGPGDGGRGWDMPRSGMRFHGLEPERRIGLGLVSLAALALVALALAILTLTGYLHWGRPRPAVAGAPPAMGGADAPPIAEHTGTAPAD